MSRKKFDTTQVIQGLGHFVWGIPLVLSLADHISVDLL